ncbi:ATP-binding cassette, subfamily B [Spirosomataceae bacterium TFI 002]|nr:ATP-binding cassette, subfamily B [Spirosomataceae bacterium TFI 002]
MDCGPTCLRMVAKQLGRNFSAQQLRTAAEIGKDGVNLLGIAKAAEKIGLKTLAVKVSLERLVAEAPMPCIVHWAQNHFVVVYKATNKKVYVADPAKGLLTYTHKEFSSQWVTTLVDGEQTGIALLLETTPAFFNTDNEEKYTGKSLASFFQYFIRYKSLVMQLGFGLLAGSTIQLIMPFLTQGVVDTGIQTRNLNFIYIVLAAQLMLFAGRMSIDFLRSWILLHISTRINLSILSDFLSKLLKLPVSYFESKQTGDIMQRIGDHRRIESFLTGTSLNVLFSMFNLVIFSFVLAYYHLTIFGVFVAASVLYSVWIVLFLRYRKVLDNKRFALSSQNQSSLISLVQAVPELKLNNATMRKRWDWENIQVKQFKLSMKSLALQQYQQVGALFINEGKNIFITFVAATAVVNGQMTLGAMMAIQYIIGQLNSPVEQLVGFIQHLQDAKLSLERLNEVHEMEEEEPAGKTFIHSLPSDKSINIENLNFTYPGAGNEPVLSDINLHIPEGKVTAIVGSSGSGKTTLLKLLLKFVQAQKGQIRIGSTQLNAISHDFWRMQCGTVMQDGYVFSDSIANNITISDENPDLHKLMHAVKVANIQEFIEELPLSYNTKIGSEGNGISQGQKQRLFIARAVYKDPEYLFFDEATNALDAENERVIMDNLEEFMRGKTVIVVAHRLSTVKNADQIIVLEKGKVVEIGTHAELSFAKGRYFDLVKNQLELAV